MKNIVSIVLAIIILVNISLASLNTRHLKHRKSVPKSVNKDDPGHKYENRRHRSHPVILESPTPEELKNSTVPFNETFGTKPAYSTSDQDNSTIISETNRNDFTHDFNTSTYRTTYENASWSTDNNTSSWSTDNNTSSWSTDNNTSWSTDDNTSWSTDDNTSWSTDNNTSWSSENYTNSTDSFKTSTFDSTHPCGPLIVALESNNYSLSERKNVESIVCKAYFAQHSKSRCNDGSVINAMFSLKINGLVVIEEYMKRSLMPYNGLYSRFVVSKAFLGSIDRMEREFTAVCDATITVYSGSAVNTSASGLITVVGEEIANNRHKTNKTESNDENCEKLFVSETQIRSSDDMSLIRCSADYPLSCFKNTTLLAEFDIMFSRDGINSDIKAKSGEEYKVSYKQWFKELFTEFYISNEFLEEINGQKLWTICSVTLFNDSFHVTNTSTRVTINSVIRSGYNHKCLTDHQCQKIDKGLVCLQTDLGKVCECQDLYFWDGVECVSPMSATTETYVLFGHKIHANYKLAKTFALTFVGLIVGYLLLVLGLHMYLRRKKTGAEKAESLKRLFKDNKYVPKLLLAGKAYNDSEQVSGGKTVDKY